VYADASASAQYSAFAEAHRTHVTIGIAWLAVAVAQVGTTGFRRMVVRLLFFPSACFGTPAHRPADDAKRPPGVRAVHSRKSLPARALAASTPQEMTSHHTRRKIESGRLPPRFCCVFKHAEKD
jgi:hypothetical protein